jgi:hypothetical protein
MITGAHVVIFTKDAEGAYAPSAEMCLGSHSLTPEEAG